MDAIIFNAVQIGIPTLEYLLIVFEIRNAIIHTKANKSFRKWLKVICYILSFSLYIFTIFAKIFA